MGAPSATSRVRASLIWHVPSLIWAHLPPRDECARAEPLLPQEHARLGRRADTRRVLRVGVAHRAGQSDAVGRSEGDIRQVQTTLRQLRATY
eukprot:222265-Prymnesium_polylepis.2